MTEIVLPNDTNQLGNLFGGRLLQFMDVCAAIAAQRHAGRIAVTAAIDFVEFRSPIRLGEIVNLVACVNRAFSTSMEVEVNVWAENPRDENRRRKANTAYYTMVAVDEQNRPTQVAPIKPVSGDEIERFQEAGRRRAIRLVLAGRLQPEEAEELSDEELLRVLKHEF